MLVRATVAVAALFAVLVLLWGWPAPSELFVAPARVPAFSSTRANAIGVTAKEKPEKPKKQVFKAPSWMRQCEYAWDCDDGLACCEFAGASICCRGGIGIPAFQPQPQRIPIPVPVPSPAYPPQRGYPGGGQGGYPGGYPPY